MAIKPICDKCGNQLDDYGGLLFSPPDADSKVTKYHLCQRCYLEIANDMPKKQTDA